MRTAAAYIRVSTDDQLEYSPDSQLLQIRRYAKDNGFLLPQQWVFVEEEGRSGRQSSKRPEFLRMIAAAKQSPKPFDAILVWKYSRHRLQVDAAQGAGHRRHLGQRISGRRQDGDHHRGDHRGDG